MQLEEELKCFSNLGRTYANLLKESNVNSTQRNLFQFYLKSFLDLFNNQGQKEEGEIFEEEHIIPSTSLLDSEEFNYFSTKIHILLGYIKEPLNIDGQTYPCLQIWKILIEDFKESPENFIPS